MRALIIGGTVTGRRGFWPPRGFVADLAVVLTSVAVLALWGWSDLGVRGWLVGLTMSLALFFRRRYPVHVAVLGLLLCGVYYIVGDADGEVWPAFVVALYTVAAQARLAVAVVLTTVGLLAFAISGWDTGTPHLADAAAFLLAGWFVAAVAIGAVVYNRRAYLQVAEERKQEELQTRAVQERLRIARELHDSLGHHLSLIHVQASAALHGIERGPERASPALATIKGTSRQALQELRRTLGVLRHAHEPGLADIGDLVAGTRSTGVDVTLRVEGDEAAVPDGVGLACYRVVQESLTNVTRHSSASEVVVRLEYGTEIAVTIDDNGDGLAGDPATAGTGIRGMADRVTALGGRFTAENRPVGGFRVAARIPLGGRT
ncbi:sensor histidine kinase [Umezawaea sp. NPDC059074]|uniref:sensor histidine kinase n=1 Tax=Umezawaea sp. NPDC059074 TaxID=3346716 RepID=UPI0036CE3DD0